MASRVTHKTFRSFLRRHNVVILQCHRGPTRGFSPKLAEYFGAELDDLGIGTLAWEGSSLPWFRRQLSPRIVTKATVFLAGLRDGYYLFVDGRGVGFAPTVDVDNEKSWKVDLCVGLFGLAVDSELPSQAWNRALADMGTDQVIATFESVLFGDDHTRQTDGGSLQTKEATDPYDVLGVSRTATDTQIKARVRELQRQNHPDRVAGMDRIIQEFTGERLRQIIEAHEAVKKDRARS